MTKPDYHASIANLTASIATALGSDAEIYPPLQQLPPATVAAADHVILLIVDGLGDNYVGDHGGLLAQHRIAQLSSVFPSSTAPAITSLMTGVAPQQHGVTGWFMMLRELGAIARLLPFDLRAGGSLADSGFAAADFIGSSSVFDRISADGHFVITADLVDSSYSNANAGCARRHGFRSLTELPATLANIVQRAARRCFVTVYWPQFDGLSHGYGVASTAVADHYRELNRMTAELLEALQGSSTLLLITADHGFIDTEPQTAIALADHPELGACLTAPLSGEPRAAYCHVDADKIGRFERYANDALAPHFDCHPSKDLVEAGWFGLYQAGPQLPLRIGDYTLVARENYVIYDCIGNERPWSIVGIHGGASAAEMQVPLIAVQC